MGLIGLCWCKSGFASSWICWRGGGLHQGTRTNTAAGHSRCLQLKHSHTSPRSRISFPLLPPPFFSPFSAILSGNPIYRLRERPEHLLAVWFEREAWAPPGCVVRERGLSTSWLCDLSERPKHLLAVWFEMHPVEKRCGIITHDSCKHFQWCRVGFILYVFFLFSLRNGFTFTVPSEYITPVSWWQDAWSLFYNSNDVCSQFQCSLVLENTIGIRASRRMSTLVLLSRGPTVTQISL